MIKARCYKIVFCALVMVCGICVPKTEAQWMKNFGKADTIRWSRYKFVNNIFQQTYNSVRRDYNDTANAGIYLNGKSEAPYMRYQGKIIRYIRVQALDFDKTFTDTTKRLATIASKVADATHTNTREFVIRNNLFLKKNTALNPYKVADNERYLRTLDYIHDARIIIDTIPDNPDSVDISVITKDFFNLSADGASNGLNHIQGRLVNANLFGMGQRVEVTGLYDYNRNAQWGYGALYTKHNVGHSFVDATVAYSVMNISGYTHEEQSTEYVQLSRPLVSPYSHFAGGLTISHNTAYNLYHTPDTSFFKYRYNVFDAWMGYNIAINQLTQTNNNIRDRRFFALRYLNYHFTELPFQTENRYDPVFNDKEAVLGELTFFRQDYFKTQYIYGFGTTEDIPYGYNIAVTGGWYKQRDLQRPYGGVNATDYIATDHGDFIQLYFKAGGFLHNGQAQDASILFGGSMFSRILFWNDTKIRQFASLSYTRLFNRVTTEPLRIDNVYGVRELLTDSVLGNQRITLSLETEFYLKYKLFGFQFAPFPFADVSLVSQNEGGIHNTHLYSGMGGGIRARNENLVFETIELRAYFYPVTPDHTKGFKVILTSNLRFRYSSNYVSEPDIIQLNSDQQ